MGGRGNGATTEGQLRMSASHTTAVGTRPTGLRTGAQYLDDLERGERAIYIDGERVRKPARHPAFRAGARAMAQLYDYAADPANLDAMTFTVPETGARALRCYQIPMSLADLRDKRIAAERWAEQTFGLMGRTPDHVGNFFTGYAAKPHVFAAGGKNFAENLQRFYRKLRDEHLYVTYAIVPPQIDRSKPAHKQADPTLYAGVTKETDAGIYISGGQQLATGGVYSDWLQVSTIHPMQPGDEAYAFNVAIPMTAPGLKLYPRRAYALQTTNEREYPLSTRFDESDCFVALDNVFVPWEQVFVYRNLEICRDQWFKTPAHMYGNHQAQARYATKLRFLLGLAQRMNEATGNASVPPVQQAMGELAAYASIVDGLLKSHEAMGEVDADGIAWPSRPSLYAMIALQSELNPKMFEIVRELTGAGMITLPATDKELDNPETRDDVARYYQSSTMTARERIALMRLAWDFIGTELASRHLQYEKFYGGASYIMKTNMYRFYDFKRATAMVDRALALPPLG
jgi:4-hydroxyphenylacetate 3-monooxygenase